MKTRALQILKIGSKGHPVPTEVALQHCFSVFLAIPSLQYRTPLVPPPVEQPLGEEQEGICTLHCMQDKPSE